MSRNHPSSEDLDQKIHKDQHNPELNIANVNHKLPRLKRYLLKALMFKNT
jgi:hypothetical protein